MPFRLTKSRVMPFWIFAAVGNGICPAPRMANGKIPATANGFMTLMNNATCSLDVGKKMTTGLTSLACAARYESFRSSYKEVFRAAIILLGTTFWSAVIALSTASACLIESGAKAKVGFEGAAILLDENASTATRKLTTREKENMVTTNVRGCCVNIYRKSRI
jgi:hypothetical protein